MLAIIQVSLLFLCHRAYFFVYAAQFLSCSLRQKHPLLDVNPVGSTFNIQNSIPHKSQKTKAVSETNRAKEFQKGTAGATESAKECDSVLPEGSDIGLGARCREFESLISDHIGVNQILLRCFYFLKKNIYWFFLIKSDLSFGLCTMNT